MTISEAYSLVMHHHKVPMTDEDHAGFIEAYQVLIDSEMVWKMPDICRAQAVHMIEQGICMFGAARILNDDGSIVPSRYDLDPSMTGSPEYVAKSRQAIAKALKEGRGEAVVQCRDVSPEVAADYDKVKEAFNQ